MFPRPKRIHGPSKLISSPFSSSSFFLKKLFDFVSREEKRNIWQFWNRSKKVKLDKKDLGGEKKKEKQLQQHRVPAISDA